MNGKKIFYTLIILVCALKVNGQDIIVLTTGDTLSGKIDILLSNNNYEEVLFQNDDNKERYKSYEFTRIKVDNQIYRTIKYGDKYRIMIEDIPGYLSLLRFRTEGNYMYNSQFLYKKDGEGMEVPALSFKKNVRDFLSDCSSLSSDLDEGKYKRKDLDEIVHLYNTCLQEKTANRYDKSVKTDLPKESSPLITEVTELLQKAQEINDDDLVTMLTDVSDKIKTGDSIPGYLKSALTNHVKNGHALKNDVNALVNKL